MERKGQVNTIDGINHEQYFSPTALRVFAMAVDWIKVILYATYACIKYWLTDTWIRFIRAIDCLSLSVNTYIVCTVYYNCLKNNNSLIVSSLKEARITVLLTQNLIIFDPEQ